MTQRLFANDQPLVGRVALITGAAQGIGRAHALHLARLGACVVVNDLGTRPDGAGSDTSAADTIVEEIAAAGGIAVADTGDVTDFDATHAMVERSIAVFGDLDIVITNAGFLRDRTLASMSESEWDDVAEVHLKGTFAPAHHAAAHWRHRWKAGTRQPARLITTSSASGIYGNVGQSNYGAAKAGIAAFTVIVAMELERYGVTVNCLAPSAMTRLTEPVVEANGGSLDDLRADLDPRFIARVAGWLCTTGADDVTGRVFDVRGRQVSVAEGWSLGPSTQQPEDDLEFNRAMRAVVRAAPTERDDGWDRRRVIATDLHSFLIRAEKFLDEHWPRRTTDSFEWGVGPDSVSAFPEIDRAEEPAALAAARAFRMARFDAGFGELTGEFHRAYERLEARYEVPDQSFFTISLGMVAPAIDAYGTDVARDRYVRPLRRGDLIGCQLFSEPGAGSDLASVTARAERDGDEWVLTGEKVWTSGAHYSDIGEVLVRTDRTAPKHAGMTAFVIDMTDPAVSVRPLRQMTGGAGFNQVFLDGVRVADDHRLGAVDQGWSVAISTLTNERAMIGDGAARGTGIADRSLDLLDAMGRANDPVARQMAADLVIHQTVTTLTNRRFRNLHGEGPPGAEASLEKLAGALDMRRLSEFAAQLLGPRLTADTGEWGTYSWSQLVMGEPALHLAGGTDEVIRNVIAERLLGLPR